MNFEKSLLRAGQLWDTVRKRLKDAFAAAGAEYSDNSVFGQLMAAVTGLAQFALSHLQDAWTENSVFTARRRRSLHNLARLSGYEPDLGEACEALVTLRVASNPWGAGPWTVRRGMRVQSASDGTVWELDLYGAEESTVSASRPLEARLIEGRTAEQRLVSTGEEYMSMNFRMTGTPDISRAEVLVDGERWARRQCLYDMAPYERAYVIRGGFDGGCTVEFGGGTHGLAPAEDAVVTLVYRSHSGDAGRVDPNADMGWEWMDDVIEELSEAVIIETSKDCPARQGRDGDCDDVVRMMTGRVSRSRVLAHPENFAEFLSRYPFIGYSRTRSVPGGRKVQTMCVRALPPTPTGAGYFQLTEESFSLTAEQKETLYKAVEGSGRMLAGTTWEIIDPKPANYAAQVFIRLKKGAMAGLVREEAVSRVGAFFAALGEDEYVPKSDIADRIRSIDGVDGVNVIFFSEANEEAKARGWYERTERGGTPSWDGDVSERITIAPGEDPRIGLDRHGDIYLPGGGRFPVLLGGFAWRPEPGAEVFLEPCAVFFENETF